MIDDLAEIEKELTEERYERRPYGWKKQIDEERMYIVINPKCHTGLGAESELQNGLRGHPGTYLEFVTHLGYVCGDGDGDPSLLYRFLNHKGRIQEYPHRKGVSFFSVTVNGGGYWHLLVNQSDRPIKLLIRSQKE